MFTPRPIGFARTPYTETKQIPKGLGARHDAEGRLEVLPEFQEGLTDIDGFDLIAKPPADAGRPHGVFATRSPRRPNPIGLTVVEVVRREGPTVFVRGVDMLDGTPILDLKPYLSSIPEDVLRRGWLAEAERRTAELPNPEGGTVLKG